jgi:hypothetical protein
MSSTAVALKQLADQGELGSQHGRLATGVLLFQELAGFDKRLNISDCCAIGFASWTQFRTQTGAFRPF